MKGPDYQTKTEDKACFLEASHSGDLLCETTVRLKLHSSHLKSLSRRADTLSLNRPTWQIQSLRLNDFNHFKTFKTVLTVFNCFALLLLSTHPN